MKSPHTKPSSYTQQEKHKLYDAKVEIQKLAGITPEMHNKLLFEVGCSFVEKNAPKSLILLTDIKLGYWDWWFFLFYKDDDLLIDHKQIPHNFDYVEFKEMMVENEVIIDLFKNQFYAQ
ncbi:MAG: hypothetical protein NTZ33_14025 [Bacteroidetes bacterium]|nr:hypothetical protein [Bacteroidota bacterium]